MLTKTRILTLIALVLTGIVLFVGSIAWLQKEAWDASIFLSALDIKQGDWIADVGSGRGKYSLEMAEAVGDMGRVFAADIDEESLEELNHAIKERNVENVTTVSSVYDNPMLPRGSFDAMLVRNAYHEFTAHVSMLRHMRKALKPGGRLVLAEYIEDDVIGEDRSAQTDEHRLAMRYARSELKDAGFTIVETVKNVHRERTNDYRTWTPAAAYRIWMRQTDARMWMIVAKRPGDSRDS